MEAEQREQHVQGVRTADSVLAAASRHLLASDSSLPELSFEQFERIIAGNSSSSPIASLAASLSSLFSLPSLALPSQLSSLFALSQPSA